MTNTFQAGVPVQETRIERPRREWGAALKALGRLLSDKEDTDQVFEIMRALNGDANIRNFNRMLETAGGGRLAYERG